MSPLSRSHYSIIGLTKKEVWRVRKKAGFDHFSTGFPLTGMHESLDCEKCHVKGVFKNTPKNDFILISHNSDAMVIDEPKWYEERDCWNADTTLIPNNLLRWFGQNVGIKHDKIESLPVGLENSYNFPYERKIEKMKNIIKQPRKIINLMYMNYNVRNNIKERERTIHLFSNKPWVTTFMGSNGYNFDGYLNNIYNHKFVLSPIGGGFESHRLWESLYVCTIPIVRRNINYSFFEDLPICFVDEWEEITENFLNNEYVRIMNSDWNLEKLSINYWIKKIESYAV